MKAYFFKLIFSKIYFQQKYFLLYGIRFCPRDLAIRRRGHRSAAGWGKFPENHVALFRRSGRRRTADQPEVAQGHHHHFHRRDFRWVKPSSRTWGGQPPRT